MTVSNYDENGMLLKNQFNISITDARRIVASLEFTADFDKTEIYYQLRNWLDKEMKNES